MAGITFRDLAEAGGFEDVETDKREKLLTVDRMVEKGAKRVRKGPILFKKHAETDETPNGELYEGFEYTPSGKVKYVPPKSIAIQDWVFDDIPHNCMIIEYGKRRTGKSVWTRDFMYKMRGQYYVAAIHTKTKFNGFFQKFIDEDYIYPDYYPSAMIKLFEKQKGIKKMKQDGTLPEDLPTYAITWLDDVVSNKGLRYQDSFVACATEGRHYDVCVGVNTQFVTGIPPSVRKNADIVVIFQQGYQSEKEMLAREYLGQLNLRTAMELIDMYTADHGCLVLELWRNKSNPVDFAFKYLAQFDNFPTFSVVPELDRETEEYLRQQEEEERRNPPGDDADDGDW